ncbi:MAG: glycosyltransferase family 4 protein, partial [Deltaproteobacteria bacterium]|nr:glycosyltransferase family 4 protein [Deltaproteobacteria bacterium]
DELALGDNVKVIGFQNDVVSFLDAIDVFAFATRSEGFGLVLVEAMAAGKPVVASKIAPLTEIVIDGETGVLVESDNSRAFAVSLSRLLSSAKERHRMGGLGQQRVQTHFTAERMSHETQMLYQALLKDSSDAKSFAHHASNLERGLGE